MNREYNAVTNEIKEQIKSSVEGKVYVGNEINEDFFFMMRCLFMEKVYLM